MVREIITWCSPCFAEDVREQATTVVVALDGGKPRALDVCERHNKELVEPLRELLAELGQLVDPASSHSSSEHVCSIAGCGKSYKSGQSLGKHMRRVHNMAMGDQSSPAEPLPDESHMRHQCPEEGCDRGFDTPQGLGAHRSRLHGYVSPHNAKGKAERS